MFSQGDGFSDNRHGGIMTRTIRMGRPKRGEHDGRRTTGDLLDEEWFGNIGVPKERWRISSDGVDGPTASSSLLNNSLFMTWKG